jgi:hypothetical protein
MGKKWQTRRATRGGTIRPDKTEVGDDCGNGDGSAATKARAMDGFSFGFLMRLPKFRSQIQF